KGGEATAAEVEENLAQVSQPTSLGGGDAKKQQQLDALVGRYEKAAQQVALGELVLAAVTDQDAPLRPGEAAERWPEIQQRITLVAWLDDQRASMRPSDDDTKKYYDSHPERFRTPRRATLWSIYKRDGEGGREATREFLMQLRKRFQDGESFES